MENRYDKIYIGLKTISTDKHFGDFLLFWLKNISQENNMLVLYYCQYWLCPYICKTQPISIIFAVYLLKYTYIHTLIYKQPFIYIFKDI